MIFLIPVPDAECVKLLALLCSVFWNSFPVILSLPLVSSCSCVPNLSVQLCMHSEYCWHDIWKTICQICSKLTALVHFGTETTPQSLGSNGQSSRSQCDKICWKQHFEGRGYSTQCLVTSLEFLVST